MDFFLWINWSANLEKFPHTKNLQNKNDFLRTQDLIKGVKVIVSFYASEASFSLTTWCLFLEKKHTSDCEIARKTQQ